LKSIAFWQSENRVMPAQAGIQEGPGGIKSLKTWIPAFAGMTEGEHILTSQEKKPDEPRITA
jgi:hypothetical protein